MKRLLTAMLLAVSCWPPSPADAQSVAPIFRRVNPSVVIIRAHWKEVAAGSGQVARVSEVGSGVLISADGKVVTAAHVVQTADEITVEFLGGEQVGARVIASEPEADVSLLQLERLPAKATVATFGNSDRSEVGDQVFIIGAPYGIAHTLSVGYITARHKPNTVYSEMALAEFFQTDAAINPGNSGGPMFNMGGEVIGVASHNISRSGGSEGLGFVVTINMARRLLLEKRSFWSGMSGIIIADRLAHALNLPQPVGLMVQQVAADSPAAQVGLRPGTIPATVDGKPLLLGGDIILAVHGERIGTESYEALQERLGQLPRGSLIAVIVLRDGHEVTLTGVKN
jgi:S1-C subfamily serine protease